MGTAINDHTGDLIRARVLSPQGQANHERIFGKRRFHGVEAKEKTGIKSEPTPKAADEKPQK